MIYLCLFLCVDKPPSDFDIYNGLAVFFVDFGSVHNLTVIDLFLQISSFSAELIFQRGFAFAVIPISATNCCGNQNKDEQSSNRPDRTKFTALSLFRLGNCL